MKPVKQRSEGVTRHFLRLIVLLAMITALVVVGWQYRHFAPFKMFSDGGYGVVSPVDQQLTFHNPYKVDLDAEENVYLINDFRTQLVKMSATGNTLYTIEPEEWPNPREYLEYSDFTVDDEGQLYALQAVMDTNGLVAKHWRFVRYTKDGDLDTEWPGHGKMVESSVPHASESVAVKSLWVDGDTLYYFAVEQNAEIQLRRFDAKKQLEGTRKLPLPPNTYIAELTGTDLDNLVYTTKRGEIFERKEGILRPLLSQYAGGVSNPKGLQSDDGENIYFIDDNGETLKKINTNRPDYVETVLRQSQIKALFKEQLPQQNVHDEGLIRRIDISQDGTLWVVTHNHVLEMDPGSEPLLLEYSDEMKQRQWIFWGAAVLTLGLLLYALKILYWEIVPTSLMYKQLFIMIPLIIGLMALLSFKTYEESRHSMEQEVRRGLINLAHDGQNLIDSELLAKIRSPKDYMSDSYRALRDKLNFADDFNKFYSTVYKYENNRLYRVLDEGEDVSMFEWHAVDRFSQDIELKTCKMRHKETGEFVAATSYLDVLKATPDYEGYVTCESKDQNGFWLFAMGPLFNAEKTQVIGMYEVGIHKHALIEREKTVRDIGVDTITKITAVILVVFLLVTYFQRKSLHKLRDSVEQFDPLNGEWQTTGINSRDEVGDLARNFDQMAEKLQGQMLANVMLQQAAARFVPDGFLKILGRKVDDKQLLGAYQDEREMDILVMNIRSFFELTNQIEDNSEKFKMINAVIKGVSEPVTGSGGFINKYSHSGLLALFESQGGEGKGIGVEENALRAAIAMCQNVQAYNASPDKPDKNLNVDIGIGLHSGHIIPGIIGEEQRYDNAVISEDVNFTYVVEELSKRAGASILVTEDFWSRFVKGYQGRDIPYQHRTLGKIKLANWEQEVALYEVFAGDAPARRKAKERTKHLFEEAIACYQDGQFEKARKQFLQVIETDSDDVMAVAYFYASAEYADQGTPEQFVGELLLEEENRG